MNGFEDVITAAVDRQLSEQRALQDVLVRVQESLEALARTVDEQADRQGPDLGGIPDAVRALSEVIRERLERIEGRLGDQPVPDVGGAVREELASALDPLVADVRQAAEAHGGRLAEIEEAVRALREDAASEPALDALHVSIRAASDDVQALAQAVLDLNAGLRDWSGRIEERVDDLSRSVSDTLRDQADEQRRWQDQVADTVVAAVTEMGGMVKESTRALGDRLDGVEQQLVEAESLSSYLRDQTEDLDKVLTGLGDVPQRLEGAVAQALRRALTVRAGLIGEAEKALDKVFSPLSSRLDRMIASMDEVGSAMSDEKLTEEVRRVAQRQSELDSRLDEMQDTVLTQLEELAESVQAAVETAAEARDAAVEASETAAAIPAIPSDGPGASGGASRKKAAPRKTARTKTTARSSSTRKPKAAAKAKTKTAAKAKAKTSKRGASGARRTRKAAGKTRTRDYIPV
ncbi:MAG TPA: hypothetical protein VM840_12820 [Actinomycetota bacterium]|nr:hypothetical protein [Actinomycetota bacterium]